MYKIRSNKPHFKTIFRVPYDDNNLNLCGKKILRQAIEHPETAYKQVEKLEKCQEMIEKSEENIQKALNLTPEEFQEQ